MRTNATERNYKQLHTLLSRAGLSGRKAEIIAGISKGRTESSRELTTAEFKGLLNWLQMQVKSDNNKADRERKKILSLCYTYGYTVYDAAKGREVVNMAALNAWLLKYSYLHKPLNDYTLQELPKLITQFENMVTGHLKELIK